MSTLISRGFGALQKIITRGFFSTPSPDCIVAFQGKIQEAGFQGSFATSLGFQGIIDDSSVGLAGKLTGERLLQGLIGNTSIGINGILTDQAGFQGDICED